MARLGASRRSPRGRNMTLTCLWRVWREGGATTRTLSQQAAAGVVGKVPLAVAGCGCHLDLTKNTPTPAPSTPHVTEAAYPASSLW